MNAIDIRELSFAFGRKSVIDSVRLSTVEFAKWLASGTLRMSEWQYQSHTRFDAPITILS